MRRQNALRKLLLQTWLTVLLAAWAVPVWARPVDASQAARTAQGWYELRFRDAGKPAADAKRTLAITADTARPIVAKGITIAYAFDTPRAGCIAIAADDQVAPVFYYSLRDRLTLPAVPPAQAIMDAFADRIAQLQAEPHYKTGPPHPLWACFARGADPDAAIDTLGAFPSAPTGPLLTSSWRQGEPYNDRCPMYQGQRCIVGCAATAMAQIMRYWQHPRTGTSSHCYYWNRAEKTLCADFGSTTYDWANMPNQATSSSPQAVKDAVSILSYHCGVAMDMHYAPDASSASLRGGAPLTKYFGYGYTRDVGRYDYDDTQWYNLMCNQINMGQPVLYSIAEEEPGEGGSHGLVLDGCDQPNLVHLNLGWAGRADGWYAINSLPAGYQSVLGAVVDIRPDVQATTYVNGATGRDTWDGTEPVGREGSRHGPKKTIQAGIYAAGPHDTVLVADGVYTGVGNTDLDFRCPSLTASGGRLIAVRSANGPANCIIDCQGAGRAFYFHSGETELSIVDGLTIRNGSADYGGAIYCDDSSPTITNCVITGNTARQLGGGIYGCNGTIHNCIISSNSAQ